MILDKDKVYQELQNRGFTDIQIEAYGELRKRGLTHTEIMAVQVPKGQGEVPLREQPLEGTEAEIAAQMARPTGTEAFLAEMTRLKSIGGMAGGILGGAMGGGVGAVPGAAAGGFLGEASEQQRAAGPRQMILGRGGMRMTGAPLDIGRLGISTAEEAAYELFGLGAGRALGFAGKKILAPFAAQMTDATKISLATLDQYMPRSKRMSDLFGRYRAILPAEANEIKLLDFAHNVAEGSIIGGGTIKQYKILRQGAVLKMLDDFAEMYAQKNTTEDIGEVIGHFLEHKWTMVRDTVGEQFYNRVFNDIGEKASINILALKEWAAPMMATLKTGKSLARAEMGDNIIKAIMTMDDNISFLAAKDLRTRFRVLGDAFKISNKKAPAIGKAEKATHILHDQIEDSLRKGGFGEQLETWLEGNRIYKEGAEKYNNKFIAALIKKAKDDPSTLLDTIFRTGRVKRLHRVRQLASKPLWNAMRMTRIAKLISDSTPSEEWIIKIAGKDVAVKRGIPSGELLLNNMFGKKGIGEAALKELLSPDEFRTLKKLAVTLRTIQQEAGKEAPGRMWIQLVQAGAAFGTVGGLFAGEWKEEIAGGSAIIMLGPYFLARMMTNPLAAKLFLEGFKAGGPVTQRGLANIARLKLKMNRMRTESQSEFGGLITKDFQEKLQQLRRR